MMAKAVCHCHGQCGRHRGECRERDGVLTRLGGRHTARIRQRSDGQWWCSFCWGVEQDRKRAEEKRAKAVAAEKQGRLF